MTLSGTFFFLFGGNASLFSLKNTLKNTGKHRPKTGIGSVELAFLPVCSQACDGNNTDSFGLEECEHLVQQVPNKKTVENGRLGWVIQGFYLEDSGKDSDGKFSEIHKQ